MIAMLGLVGRRLDKRSGAGDRLEVRQSTLPHLRSHLTRPPSPLAVPAPCEPLLHPPLPPSPPSCSCTMKTASPSLSARIRRRPGGCTMTWTP